MTTLGNDPNLIQLLQQQTLLLQQLLANQKTDERRPLIRTPKKTLRQEIHHDFKEAFTKKWSL